MRKGNNEKRGVYIPFEDAHRPNGHVTYRRFKFWSLHFRSFWPWRYSPSHPTTTIATTCPRRRTAAITRATATTKMTRDRVQVADEGRDSSRRRDSSPGTCFLLSSSFWTILIFFYNVSTYYSNNDRDLGDEDRARRRRWRWRQGLELGNSTGTENPGVKPRVLPGLGYGLRLCTPA